MSIVDPNHDRAVQSLPHKRDFMSSHASDSRQRRSRRYLALHDQLRREVEAARYRPKTETHRQESRTFRQTGEIHG